MGAYSGEPINIGQGHRIQFYTRDGIDGVVGIIDWHLRPDNGQECGGGVLFDLPCNADLPKPEHRWKVSKYKILGEFTLEPSLLCTSCGDHGWIRNGRWVNA